jgi:hypothetical protein
MIKNILKGRDPESIWRSEGWGSEWTFPAVGAQGEQLDFKIRTPLEWAKADVRALPETSPPESVAQAMRRLSSAVGTAGVVALLGVEHTVARQDEPDLHLFATLTVALKDLPGAMPESLPDAQVGPIELNTPGGLYRGVRIRRLAQAELVPDRPAMPYLTVQYMVRTDYGVLASTFATPQVGTFDGLMAVFDKIATACWLDPA